MMKKETEKICFNCNNFFPASQDEATEYGICLNDEAFDPFIEELFEKSNYTCCQDLIKSKKFSGERDACPDFSEIEIIGEIDDNSEFGKELKILCEKGQLNPETFKEALFKEQIRNIDWKTVPVDEHVKQLKSSIPKKRDAGVSSLGALISLGNEAAFQELLDFFRKLPPPVTLEEVYFKRELLRHLRCSKTKSKLIPVLVNELYQTPSNNTTRQWISDIFNFLRYCPHDEISLPFKNMLKDKRFSYRLKQKMKAILYEDSDYLDWL
jgi:hypothetical protein